ncbi:MAG: hypothetical protein KKB66_02475 [Alphaproteobacteria bacterium]|nr:hypothetical protein [Alphaproteobacteria bacterium]MBU0802127.1 hypothetical protein [Alphaproteobacteria bacterium]MBU0872266.1 hypothetical protein [Alphaproteobacteria bacterium]MBU1399626.1 hypothetical protein [Alphaproteobacteria bacterium]MBU1590012.1 hypothetical protein [Alphaproteobacteria bacterium]
MSDNRILNVNGESLERLKIAMSLAGESKAVGFANDEDRLVFFWTNMKRCGRSRHHSTWIDAQRLRSTGSKAPQNMVNSQIMTEIMRKVGGASRRDGVKSQSLDTPPLSPSSRAG